MKIILSILLSLMIIASLISLLFTCSGYAWIAVPDPIGCDTAWTIITTDNPSATNNNFTSFAVSYEFDIDNDGEADESGDLFSASQSCVGVIVNGEMTYVGCEDSASITISTATGVLSAGHTFLSTGDFIRFVYGYGVNTTYEWTSIAEVTFPYTGGSSMPWIGFDAEESDSTDDELPSGDYTLVLTYRPYHTTMTQGATTARCLTFTINKKPRIPIEFGVM